MDFGRKSSKGRKTITFDLPQEESGEFDHSGNYKNQCDKEETGGKKKGGLVRWLKKRFSKKRDRARNKSKGYEEFENKSHDYDANDDADVIEDDDVDGDSDCDNDDSDSSLDSQNDDDNKDNDGTLNLHHDDDNDSGADDKSEVLGRKDQLDNTCSMGRIEEIGRGGQKASQMGWLGNMHAYPTNYGTHGYPSNNMHEYPSYNSAYHPYAYSSYNTNAYPAYNMHGTMFEHPTHMYANPHPQTDNMNMPSNSDPTLEHTFNYFTAENPTECAIM